MSQLSRATLILRALAQHPEGRTAMEVAADVGLPRSTAHRLLQCLAAEELATQGSDGKRYRLGPTLASLGISVQSRLVALLHPLVAELSEATVETVDVSIRCDDRALFIDQVASPGRLQAVSQVGASFPVHTCASGKALLAELGDDHVRALLGGGLARFTDNTITDIDDLLSALATIRATGIAHARAEHTIGISAIAAASASSTGLPVALAIPVPTARFAEREETLVSMLVDGVKRVRLLLG